MANEPLRQSRRELSINWPEGFDPSGAQLFVHSEIFIDAPCEQVWKRLVDVSTWPNWFSGVEKTEILAGPPWLRRGSVFKWTILGVDLESSVHESEPLVRLGWFNYVAGSDPQFYRSWYSTPQRGGCLVTCEEVGLGPAAAQLANFRKDNERATAGSHEDWLAALKYIVESRQ